MTAQPYGHAAPHGSLYRYRHGGCRCATCLEEHRIWLRNRRVNIDGPINVQGGEGGEGSRLEPMRRLEHGGPLEHVSGTYPSHTHYADTYASYKAQTPPHRGVWCPACRTDLAIQPDDTCRYCGTLKTVWVYV